VRLHQALRESRCSPAGDSSVRSVDIEWKPFQIDPGTAVIGESFEAYNQRRWGSSGWTRPLKTTVEDGRTLFTDWQWWPNTKKAHQLVHYLTRTQTTTRSTIIDSDKVNQVLFEAAYEQGLNISTVDVVVRVAQAAFGGPNEDDSSSSLLDWDDLRDYLEHDRGWSEVEREMEAGRRTFRIRGVPYFVITDGNDGKVVKTLSGAQPVSAFRSVLDGIMN
jgi:predicted DsbA family dithiol-disulfide isomerase